MLDSSQPCSAGEVRVSIIIPHFNRSGLLVETVQSLQSQTMPSWEAVVVDDQSTPEHWDAIRPLESDARIKVIQRNREPKGPSACRNIGLSVACGEYVIFLDSDDLLAPWCLKSRLDEISQYDEIDFLVSHVLLFEKQLGDSDLLWNQLTHNDNNRECVLQRFLTQSPPWCVTSPLWKRSSVKRINGFNERVVYGDDADLHIRALLGGLKHRISDQPLPDTFIRRSDQPRITNTLSGSMLESRMVRLTEGSKAVAMNPSAAKSWESQYFVEAEFCLFNLPACQRAVRDVLNQWNQHHSPNLVRKLVLHSYFALAVRSRESAYFLLRVARRITLLLIPKSWSVVTNTFQNARLPEPVFCKLSALLAGDLYQHAPIDKTTQQSK